MNCFNIFIFFSKKYLPKTLLPGFVFGGLFFFCCCFFQRELEPFWLLIALNDGGQKYNPNASFLTILAGRVMYVTGAHPVGTC